MASKLAPLLCELHAHTTWSDGSLTGCGARPWVAAAGLPGVACGDFNVLEHLAGWKTMLPCVKDREAVVGYLRSPRPAFLVRLETQAELLRAA